jgi:hypothetical protein
MNTKAVWGINTKAAQLGRRNLCPHSYAMGFAMTKKLLFATTILLVCAFGALAADVTGKWTGQVAGRNGPQDITLNLKAEGGKLTGTVLGGGGGRQAGGGTPMPREISDGKVDGNNISFKVSFDAGGQTRTTTYTGTLAGEELKMKQTREGRNGPQTAEFALKRSAT